MFATALIVANVGLFSFKAPVFQSIAILEPPGVPIPCSSPHEYAWSNARSVLLSAHLQMCRKRLPRNAALQVAEKVLVVALWD